MPRWHEAKTTGIDYFDDIKKSNLWRARSGIKKKEFDSGTFHFCAAKKQFDSGTEGTAMSWKNKTKASCCSGLADNLMEVAND
jgi:hypothetical protein